MPGTITITQPDAYREPQPDTHGDAVTIAQPDTHWHAVAISQPDFNASGDH